jgi:hypothetical protein
MLKKIGLVAMVAAGVSMLSLPIFAGRTGNFGEEAFNASINLFRSIQIRKISDLSFGDVVALADKKVVVEAGDSGAAIFEAFGDKQAHVIGRVQEASIEMASVDRRGDTITVDSWAYGGSMDKNGAATFDKDGDLYDLRVGAAAHVKSDNDAGRYVGQATFRLTYV